MRPSLYPSAKRAIEESRAARHAVALASGDICAKRLFARNDLFASTRFLTSGVHPGVGQPAIAGRDSNGTFR